MLIKCCSTKLRCYGLSILACSLGSAGCGQLCEVQLAAGYLLHIREFELELMLFNVFINNLNNGIEVYAHEVHKHYHIAGSGWYAGGQNCYSEKPQQTVEIVYQEHPQC